MVGLYGMSVPSGQQTSVFWCDGELQWVHMAWSLVARCCKQVLMGRCVHSMCGGNRKVRQGLWGRLHVPAASHRITASCRLSFPIITSFLHTKFCQVRADQAEVQTLRRPRIRKIGSRHLERTYRGRSGKSSASRPVTSSTFAGSPELKYSLERCSTFRAPALVPQHSSHACHMKAV
jgi:hypothetical protein